MQADLGVPPKARITLTDVSVDAKATPDTTRRTQFVAAAAVAAVGATILLTGVIDGLIMARRARRSEALAAAEEPQEPEEPEEPEVLREPADQSGQTSRLRVFHRCSSGRRQ